MSMLVLQPRIAVVTACMGIAVSEGMIGVSVNVGDGVSESAGVIRIMSGVAVSVMNVGKVGGGRIKGVAVTRLGVREGIGVHTGNGCGGTPQVSHAESKNPIVNNMRVTFFISRLYLLILSAP
jgi:hypothetical protein